MRVNHIVMFIFSESDNFPVTFFKIYIVFSMIGKRKPSNDSSSGNESENFGSEPHSR